MTAALLFAAYVLQQRCTPFLRSSTLSSGLGLSIDELEERLQQSRAQVYKVGTDAPSSIRRTSSRARSRSLKSGAGSDGSGAGTPLSLFMVSGWGGGGMFCSERRQRRRSALGNGRRSEGLHTATDT